jgi:hypothetical protein
LLHGNDDSPSIHDHGTIDHKLDKFQSDMSKAMDNKMQSLGEKLFVEIKVLGTEIRVLGTTMDARFATMDARIKTSNAKIQSKFDGLKIELKDREARFWARVFFTVSGLLGICYLLPSNSAKVLAVAGVTSSAAFLQY